MELLIGAGRDRTKKLYIKEKGNEWNDLKTLDNNPDIETDYFMDLNKGCLPLPVNSVDEIHAYDVLEHLGSQGDYKFFFKEFSEYWRVLKPGGYFFAIVPSIRSHWALGDPSHTRVFCQEWLVFLSQAEYVTQIDVEKRNMSDFRYLYTADFETIYSYDDGTHLKFILKAIK